MNHMQTSSLDLAICNMAISPIYSIPQFLRLVFEEKERKEFEFRI